MRWLSPLDDVLTSSAWQLNRAPFSFLMMMQFCNEGSFRISSEFWRTIRMEAFSFVYVTFLLHLAHGWPHVTPSLWRKHRVLFCTPHKPSHEHTSVFAISFLPSHFIFQPYTLTTPVPSCIAAIYYRTLHQTKPYQLLVVIAFSWNVFKFFGMRVCNSAPVIMQCQLKLDSAHK